MSRLADRVRRQLAAQGFTPKPVCPACQMQLDPKSFGTSGVCLACEAAATDTRIQDLDRRIARLWPVIREQPERTADADEYERLLQERMAAMECVCGGQGCQWCDPAMFPTEPETDVLGSGPFLPEDE